MGYADELSKTYTVLLVERVSEHLGRHGVDLRQVQWQTDNGSEFMYGAHHRGLPSTVRAWGSSNQYILPKAYDSVGWQFAQWGCCVVVAGWDSRRKSRCGCLGQRYG